MHMYMYVNKCYYTTKPLVIFDPYIIWSWPVATIKFIVSFCEHTNIQTHTYTHSCTHAHTHTHENKFKSYHYYSDVTLELHTCTCI